MAHTVLSNSDWEYSRSTQLSYFVPLAEDRLLVFACAVKVVDSTSTEIASVSWGGIDMTTSIQHSIVSGDIDLIVHFWYLDEAGIQSAGDQGSGLPFTVTWLDGEPDFYDFVCSAASYKYVDQNILVDASVVGDDAASPASLIEANITSEPGSLTISLAACFDLGNYYWDEYWMERVDETSGMTFSTSDRIVSTLTPQVVSAEFQGTNTNGQILAAIEIHRASVESPEILLDSRGGGNTPDQLFVEFSMPISNVPNGLMFIAPAYEFGVDTTGYTSLVQVNGDDATFVASETAGCTTDPECVGIHNTVDLWYYVAPPDGTATVRVEVTMTQTTPGDPTPRDFMVSAAHLYNVGPPTILSVLTDFDNEPLPTELTVYHPPSLLTGNSIIVDGLVMGNPIPPLTGISNQLKIADQQGIGAASSRSTLAFKYSESTPLGESSWFQDSSPGDPGLRAAMVSLAIDSFSDSTAPTFICTDTEVEDVTLEFCEDRDLLRMHVSNQGDDVDVFFEFDTCTLQVLNIITSGTSSRNLRFTYEGTPTTLTPNDTEDVSAQNIYFTAVGPYYLPTLVLEKEYSITFI